jgi:hypothetical protein
MSNSEEKPKKPNNSDEENKKPTNWAAIITAIAGLVTALGGCLAVILNADRIWDIVSPPTPTPTSPSPTVLITDTPTTTPPSIVFVTDTPPPEPVTVAPEAVLENYFDEINRGHYLAAWETLHENQKEKSPSYDGYVDYWEKNISEVLIDKLVPVTVDSEAGQGEILASLTYVMKDKNEYPFEFRFCFVLNEQRTDWLIHLVVELDDTCDFP